MAYNPASYKPAPWNEWDGTDRNPVRRFRDMLDLIDAARNGRDSSHKLVTDPATDDFYGTSSFADAECLYRDGWQHGTAQVDALRHSIRLPEVTTARISRAMDVAGGSVDVGRYVSGDPCHMRRVVMSPARPIVRVAAAGAFLARVRAEEVLLAGAALCVLVEHLHTAGYGVAIDLVGTSAPCTVSPLTAIQTWTVIVPIKEPHQPLDMGTVAFAIAHPSTFRRFVFGARECDHPAITRAMQAHHGGSYGSSVYPSPHAAGYDIDLTSEPQGSSPERAAAWIMSAVDEWLARR